MRNTRAQRLWRAQRRRFNPAGEPAECRTAQDVGCLLTHAQIASGPSAATAPGVSAVTHSTDNGSANGRRLADDTSASGVCNHGPDRQPAPPLASSATERYAFAVSLCNTTDYYGSAGRLQVDRALGLLKSLKYVGSKIEPIAFSHSYSPSSVRRLTDAGWHVHDVSHMPLNAMLRPILGPEEGRHFPRRARVQPRADGGCTALKFLAWNLTQFTRVFHADTDVCMQQDPLPWAAVHARLGTYFTARHENAASRGYNGLNAHFLFLQPDRDVYSMLADSARTGSFVPHTNNDQDILETVFTAQPHLESSRSDGVFPLLPKHIHDKKCRARPLRTFNEVALSARDAKLLAARGGVPAAFNATTPVAIVPDAVAHRLQIKAFTDADGWKLQKSYAILMRDAPRGGE